METNRSAVVEISELLEKLATRFTQEDPQEQDFMRKQLSTDGQRALSGLSVSALHLLSALPPRRETSDAPDEQDALNVVGLAERAGVAKGTVSKAVPRLEAAGVIERFQRPTNRKEVLLRVTELGEEIRRAHVSLHDEMQGSFAKFLARYPDKDLQVVIRIMTDLLHTPRDGVRFL